MERGLFSGRLLAANLCFFALAHAGTGYAAEPTHHFSIPSEDLATALEDFGRQSGEEILFNRDDTRGKTAHPVSGDYTSNDVLSKLLAGSGLSVRQANAHTFVVELGARSPSQPNDKSQSGPLEPTTSKDTSLEEVIVTGTHIRGVTPDSSPIIVYGRDEISRSGAATLSDFSREMPQNFAAAVPGTANLGLGGTIDAGSNFNDGAAFNLHGLGVGATLTLINGHRITGAGNDGEFVDISLIPLSAIDRIEVLPDGASAIYGADAVAGVVNVILRKDFEGAETGIRYGDTTSGGAGQISGTQLLGHAWETGNAMLVYEFNKQNSLNADDRPFIPAQDGALAVIPEKKVDSVFANASQRISDTTSLQGSAFFSKSTFLQDIYIGIPFSTLGDSKLGGGTFDLDQRLAGDWNVGVTGSYSKLDQAYTNNFTSFPFSSFSTTNTSLASGEFRADGTAFSTPAGAVKVALGSTFRSERVDYAFVDVFSGAVDASQNEKLNRNIFSVYGEALVPVISNRNSLAWVKRLELSVAVRSDHYSDFGNSVNPKFGVLWSPVGGVNIRGTYGKSFHPPLLTAIAPNLQLSEQSVPDSRSPSGSTIALVDASNNTQLQPEKSRSFTAGVDWIPENLASAKLSATYFNIKYKDRIAYPPVIGNLDLGQPQLAPFVETPADPSKVTAAFATGAVFDETGTGAAGVQSYFDSRQHNVAISSEAGIDFSALYSWSRPFGDVGTFFNTEYLLRNAYQEAQNLPVFSLLNVLNEPVKFRAHYGATWALRGWHSALTLNTSGAYDNPTISPAERVSSWTTADLQIGYKIGDDASAGFFKKTSISLTVINIANADPPHVTYPLGGVNLGYDPFNANPLGRMFVMQVQKAL